MGVAVKGGQWCPRCEQPVAGQKTTHRASGGAWLVATGLPRPGDGHHCPTCGHHTVPDAGPGRRMVYDDAGKMTFESKRDGVQPPPMDLDTLAGWGLIAIVALVCILAVFGVDFGP